jgi:hypothetical protein
MHTGSRGFARAVRTALAVVLTAPLFLAHAGAAVCDVRLNEIMPAPGKDWDGNALFSARDDEWVELVNTSALTLDLSQYFITDADSTIRWAGAGTIAPNEHRVVYGSDAVLWQHDHGRAIAGLSLANAGDTVRLWQAAGADTLLIESYTFDAHQAGTDRAIGRMPDGAGTEWQLFDGLDPYTGSLEPKGNGCNPTPKLTNACDLSPATPSTWGRLKAQYH